MTDAGTSPPERIRALSDAWARSPRHHQRSGNKQPSRHMTWLLKYFTSTGGAGGGLNDGQPLRREGVDTMDWRHIAACREVDPELFFPIGNSGPALLQIDEAKQVCRRCTVMEECLRWAIDSGQDAGVWGGLSEDERRALKRRTIRLRARAHALPV